MEVEADSRENFREKSTKRRKDKEKGNTAGSVKPGKPYARKYGLSVWPNPFGRVNKPFFPVCQLWVTACPIYGRAVTCSFPLPAQKNSKRKKSQKIRKSTFVA